MQLQVVLTDLSPFVESPQQAKGSVLLKEVESVSSPHQSFLMHKLAAAGAYIQLFIYLSKSGQVSKKGGGAGFCNKFSQVLIWRGVNRGEGVVVAKKKNKNGMGSDR